MHLALDGQGVPPDEWMVSRVCEEFHCTPAEALDQPYDLTMTVMHMRAYASAKQALEQAKRQSDVPITPIVRQVVAVREELMADAKAQRRV